MNCEHCNSILSSLSSLNYHKLHNKKCIIKQGLLIVNQIFPCNLCKKHFTTKNSLVRHNCLKNKVEKKSKIEKLNNINILLETYRNEINLENEVKNKELEIYRTKIELKNNELEIELKNKELEIELKNKELERYRNIVNLEKEVQRKEIEILYKRIEKLDKTMSDALLQSVNKPTISNTTTTHNNFNLIPLDIGHRNNIKDIVENHYNLEYQINGQKGLAKLLSDSGVLKPKGENIYICSDSSRGIFKYKNENGIEIRDIQAKDLTSWIHATAIKNIKKEGLQRAIELFECIGRSETTETAQPFAIEQNKLIEAHTSIVNMNDDNKEFVRALGVCI